MSFPQTRLRRWRGSAQLRDLVRETHLHKSDLVMPLFVEEGLDGRTPITSLPGIDRLSVDAVVEEAGTIAAAGIGAVMLFGLPSAKDSQGSGAWSDDGIVQVATRAIKQAHPDLLVFTDLCLCEYTDHGHCGVVRPDGHIDNDSTLELLARTAVSQAVAGADVLAPSDMMDGRVGALRAALDQAGHADTLILSHAVKYASAFYGPFRDAVQSAPSFGDRRSHQMDPANSREALREVALDIEEGADAVMVKPALPYLDVISKVKASTDVPVAAYNVSGEYAMLKAAAAAGALDERAAVLEALLSIKRAGADIIVSYHALEATQWLD